MRVLVHPDTCIASGRCTWLAPEVFGQADDGLVVLVEEAPAAESHDRVRDAAANCPSRSIETDQD